MESDTKHFSGGKTFVLVLTSHLSLRNQEAEYEYPRNNLPEGRVLLVDGPSMTTPVEDN